MHQRTIEPLFLICLNFSWFMVVRIKSFERLQRKKVLLSTIDTFGNNGTFFTCQNLLFIIHRRKNKIFPTLTKKILDVISLLRLRIVGTEISSLLHRIIWYKKTSKMRDQYSLALASSSWSKPTTCKTFNMLDSRSDHLTTTDDYKDGSATTSPSSDHSTSTHLSSGNSISKSNHHTQLTILHHQIVLHQCS